MPFPQLNTNCYMLVVNLQKMSVVKMPYRGQVGAGRVVELLPLRQPAREIPVPAALAHHKFEYYTACGDSFIEDGVRPGDIVVARADFHIAECVGRKPCIVRLPENGLTMKYVRQREDTQIELRSANILYEPMLVEAELIEIVALVEFTVHQFGG